MTNSSFFSACFHFHGWSVFAIGLLLLGCGPKLEPDAQADLVVPTHNGDTDSPTELNDTQTSGSDEGGDSDSETATSEMDDTGLATESEEDSDTIPVVLNIDYEYPAGSPVATHGNLRVEGTHLVDESGEVVQLRGMSSYGLQWGGGLLTDELLQQLRAWGFESVRLAMYTNNSGYADVTDEKREEYNELIDSLVSKIGRLGMYVIIDWHVLEASGFSGDPWVEIEMAKMFFEYMAQTHANKPHVLFEIANEPSPTGVEWVKEGENNDIREYANEIIPIIRKYDQLSSVIIVGTPVWSTVPAYVLSDMLDFPNVMYALHFYAGFHYDRWTARKTIENAPVFVSEWGVSNETGRGGNDYENADKWLDMLDEYQVSWCNWSISYHESSSMFDVDGWGVTISPPFEEKLSDSGRYLLHRLSGSEEPFVPSN